MVATFLSIAASSIKKHSVCTSGTNFSERKATSTVVSSTTRKHLIAGIGSLEQIAYLIESITEDIIYVAEAKDIRHADNRLAIEKEQ